jgi:hypothetical protein
VVLGVNIGFSVVKRVDESLMSAGAASRLGGTIEACAATTETFGGAGATIVMLRLFSADHTTARGIGIGFGVVIWGGASG